MRSVRRGHFGEPALQRLSACGDALAKVHEIKPGLAKCRLGGSHQCVRPSCERGRSYDSSCQPQPQLVQSVVRGLPSIFHVVERRLAGTRAAAIFGFKNHTETSRNADCTRRTMPSRQLVSVNGIGWTNARLVRLESTELLGLTGIGSNS